MQSLAVKYRPTSFDDVSEQRAIKSILREQLVTKTHKNCYLFTGGAGTGKTTCARIFASDLNEGKGLPVEIDAASNNGVDNVREIIDNAKFKALDCEYKVYIIDECHMLSTGAWNAMLKLIEEPPAKTVFIFCTTDPQKIPATILSRVQRYDFQRLTHEAIVNRLEYILTCENSQDANNPDLQNIGDITREPAAIDYIAKLADGGLRDAITLLDKCLSFSSAVTLENVVEALGTINYDFMFDITNAVYVMQPAEVIQCVEQLHRSGADLKQFIKQYTLFVLDLCKYDLLRNFDYLQIPSIFSDRVEKFKDDAFDFFRTLLDSMIKLSADIKWETSPKPLIEATLILLCSNTAVVDEEGEG